MTTRRLYVLAILASVIGMVSGCGREPKPVTIFVPPALLQELEAKRPAACVFLTPAGSPLTSLADVGPQGLVALQINPVKDKTEALSLFAIDFTMICSRQGAVRDGSDGRIGFSMIPTPDVFVSRIGSPPKLVIAWEEDRARITGGREVKFVAQPE